MKRVLHISKYYYPFRGGTEQIARDCVNALGGEYEQKVICFSEGKEDTVDTVDDIEVIRVGCFIKIASQSISFKYQRILKNVIRNFSPDIIIFHYPNPFVAHYLLKIIPTTCRLAIYWHLDIVKQRFLRLFFSGQNRKLVNRAERLIATSPLYVEGSPFLSSVREKCAIIPNCIDPERLKMTIEAKKTAEEIRKNNAGKTICFAVGRHTKYKGYEYLIRAAHLLDDSFQFFIAGEGEETKHLIKEAGKDNKIYFVGSLDDDTLKGYFSAMDIFCFPSVTKNEAFGLALAEAMYFEKPAVTFSIPGSGVNYVCLEGDNGIEVPNRDVAAYAEALKRLSNDSDLRRKMGEAGKKRVQDFFLHDQFTNNIRQVIGALYHSEIK